MGSSGSNGLTGSNTKYTHSSWTKGRKKGLVQIRSCKVQSLLNLATHHCLVVNNIGEKWRVYEWSSSGFETYGCERLYGKTCFDVGRYTLDEVMAACRKASKGKSYSGIDYNCNHWTAWAAYYLSGKDYTLSWSCNR